VSAQRSREFAISEIANAIHGRPASDDVQITAESVELLRSVNRPLSRAFRNEPHAKPLPLVGEPHSDRMPIGVVPPACISYAARIKCRQTVLGCARSPGLSTSRPRDIQSIAKMRHGFRRGREGSLRRHERDHKQTTATPCAFGSSLRVQALSQTRVLKSSTVLRRHHEDSQHTGSSFVSCASAVKGAQPHGQR
jgi:hypothetical protein